VTNKDGEKFLYTGKIHTLDEEKEDTIESGSFLRIEKYAFKRSLDEEKKLHVEITIRNLKEEAKDDDEESGVSDGE